MIMKREKIAINRLAKNSKFPINKSFLIIKNRYNIDYDVLAEFANNHYPVILSDADERSVQFVSLPPNLDKSKVPHFKSSLK